MYAFLSQWLLQLRAKGTVPEKGTKAWFHNCSFKEQLPTERQQPDPKPSTLLGGSGDLVSIVIRYL